MEQSTASQSQPAGECNSLKSDPPIKRGPGRPKGSKTKRYEIIDHNLPACVKCGRTNLRHLGTNKIFAYQGVHDGQPFNEIAWYRKQCDICGQVQIVKHYRMKP